MRNLIYRYYYIGLPVIAVLWNQLIYSGSNFITRGWNHYNIETKLDMAIPFIPQSLIIYFGCYIFWFINYILCAKQDRRHAYAFFIADYLSKALCLLCFLLLPTTNTRPEIIGNSIFHEGMRFLYHIDAASNLFPSIHCLVSWLCYIGIRDHQKIPKWYQYFSLCFAVLVFMSTLTTKQHVIIDVISAVVIAEVMYAYAKKLLSL